MDEPSWTRRPPQTILLATDLSSRCDRAMDRAAQLAGVWDARVIVLHVMEPEAFPDGRRYEAELPSWRRPPDREAVASAQVRRDLREALKSVEVRLAEGDPASVIDGLAREVGAELIVTGVARDETLGRYLLGATVDRLARRTAVPLLVVKSRPRPYHEVLVATDFSEPSRHALIAAARFFPKSPITLLHAWEAPFPGFLDSARLHEVWGEVKREACAEFVAGAQLSPDRRRDLQVLIEHGRPEVMVRLYMRDRGVDFVAVGTHGRSGIFDIRLGGTAKQILESAPGDVLLVPEPRARARIGTAKG